MCFNKSSFSWVKDSTITISLYVPQKDTFPRYKQLLWVNKKGFHEADRQFLLNYLTEAVSNSLFSTASRESTDNLLEFW